MKRFLAFCIAWVMVPSLALASVGGFRCGDGILRPHCCCPQESISPPEAASPAQWEALPCCEFSPGSSLHVEAPLENSKGFEAGPLFIAQRASFETAFPHFLRSRTTPTRKPPPPVRLFVNLLI